jgi:hypothetical protein
MKTVAGMVTGSLIAHGFIMFYSHAPLIPRIVIDVISVGSTWLGATLLLNLIPRSWYLLYKDRWDSADNHSEES